MSEADVLVLRVRDARRVLADAVDELYGAAPATSDLANLTRAYEAYVAAWKAADREREAD